MESREDFYFDDSDNPGSDDMIEKEEHYILRYITLDYLLNNRNLKRFVELASDSNWLPHYYNALYFALKKESNDKKSGPAPLTEPPFLWEHLFHGVIP